MAKKNGIRIANPFVEIDRSFSSVSIKVRNGVTKFNRHVFTIFLLGLVTLNVALDEMGEGKGVPVKRVSVRKPALILMAVVHTAGRLLC